MIKVESCRLSNSGDVKDCVENLEASGIDLPSFRAIEQYQKSDQGRRRSWKTYYLCHAANTDVFKSLRKNPWFVSPDALYIHPHMKMVKLTSPDSNLSDRQKQLNVRTINLSFRSPKHSKFLTWNVDKTITSNHVQSSRSRNNPRWWKDT